RRAVERPGGALIGGAVESVADRLGVRVAIRAAELIRAVHPAVARVGSEPMAGIDSATTAAPGLLVRRELWRDLVDRCGDARVAAAACGENVVGDINVLEWRGGGAAVVEKTRLGGGAARRA